MAWETRVRGGRYYTRSRRVGGRLVREYLGTGPAAEVAAASDAVERIRRARLAATARAALGSLAALDAQIADLSRRSQVVLTEALTRAGYHRHHRGVWRRRRGDSS